MTHQQIAVVVSGFPRRSETFALNELGALVDRGLLAGIYATKPGDGTQLQPGCERLLPFVEFLPGKNDDEQGAALAGRLAARNVSGVHAYFAHAPAAVAESASARLSLRFGFSVHARDARKVDTATLVARARHASCVVACNRDVAKDLHDSGASAHLVPHGVDLERFSPTPASTSDRLRVLAVGRLVPKKGFDVLIDAVAATRGDITLRIVGDGPEHDALLARIVAHGLTARVTLAGGRTHTALPAEYSAADVVVVPSVIDGSGDRDGLPNVVLEAIASGRPVIGTNVGAIGAAVTDGVTGMLIPSESAAAIARSLEVLAANVNLRLELGRSARAEAVRRYDLASCVDRFARLLEAAYA
jgi:glycosyltransferase involved in cell wall biosynthesis